MKCTNKSLRVLIVDDCHDTTSSMQRLCVVLGHETLAVSNGLAAVDVAKDFQPHVIIMDISMPRLDGCAAARRIRQLEGGDAIMLVAMTGRDSETDRQQTADAGFDYHWVKPVVLRRLRLLFDQVADEAMQYRLPANLIATDPFMPML